jgi:hypothetical protein
VFENSANKRFDAKFCCVSDIRYLGEKSLCGHRPKISERNLQLSLDMKSENVVVIFVRCGTERLPNIWHVMLGYEVFYKHRRLRLQLTAVYWIENCISKCSNVRLGAVLIAYGSEFFAGTTALPLSVR